MEKRERTIVDELGPDFILRFEDGIGGDVSAIRKGETLYITDALALALLATGAASAFFRAFISTFSIRLGEILGSKAAEATSNALLRITNSCVSLLKKPSKIDELSIQTEQNALMKELRNIPALSLREELLNEPMASRLGADVKGYLVECGFTERRAEIVAKRLIENMKNS